MRTQRTLDHGRVVELGIVRELRLHPERQVSQQTLLGVGQRVRFGVEHAQSSDGLAAGRMQRVPGIEAEVRIAHHEWLSAKTSVVSASSTITVRSCRTV